MKLALNQNFDFFQVHNLLVLMEELFALATPLYFLFVIAQGSITFTLKSIEPSDGKHSISFFPFGLYDRIPQVFKIYLYKR